MVQIRELLSRLRSNGVEYIIVGGVAARLHGSTLPTQDLDICCRMSPENMQRLLHAIGDLRPIFCFDPRRLPLPTDASELARFNTLLLTTDLGRLDVLREITGVGDFEALSKCIIAMELYGAKVNVLDIDALITAKKAAGREKDKLGVMYLEAVKRRQGKK
jgi:hypothetical protein